MLRYNTEHSGKLSVLGGHDASRNPCVSRHWREQARDVDIDCSGADSRVVQCNPICSTGHRRRHETVSKYTDNDRPRQKDDIIISVRVRNVYRNRISIEKNNKDMLCNAPNTLHCVHCESLVIHHRGSYPQHTPNARHDTTRTRPTRTQHSTQHNNHHNHHNTQHTTHNTQHTTHDPRPTTHDP